MMPYIYAVAKQRYFYKTGGVEKSTLTADRIRRLDELGFEWDPPRTSKPVHEVVAAVGQQQHQGRHVAVPKFSFSSEQPKKKRNRPSSPWGEELAGHAAVVQQQHQGQHVAVPNFSFSSEQPKKKRNRPPSPWGESLAGHVDEKEEDCQDVGINKNGVPQDVTDDRKQLQRTPRDGCYEYSSGSVTSPYHKKCCLEQQQYISSLTKMLDDKYDAGCSYPPRLTHQQFGTGVGSPWDLPRPQEQQRRNMLMPPPLPSSYYGNAAAAKKTAVITPLSSSHRSDGDEEESCSRNWQIGGVGSDAYDDSRCSGNLQLGISSVVPSTSTCTAPATSSSRMITDDEHSSCTRSLEEPSDNDSLASYLRMRACGGRASSSPPSSPRLPPVSSSPWGTLDYAYFGGVSQQQQQQPLLTACDNPNLPESLKSSISSPADSYYSYRDGVAAELSDAVTTAVLKHRTSRLGTFRTTKNINKRARRGADPPGEKIVGDESGYYD
jgi:hypothetical protein